MIDANAWLPDEREKDLSIASPSGRHDRRRAAWMSPHQFAEPASRQSRDEGPLRSVVVFLADAANRVRDTARATRAST